jgi:hypothetical protein
MSNIRELPVTVVGQRRKTNAERFADAQRIARPLWKGRAKGVEIMDAEGRWIPYERRARRDPAAHD